MRSLCVLLAVVTLLNSATSTKSDICNQQHQSCSKLQKDNALLQVNHAQTSLHKSEEGSTIPEGMLKERRPGRPPAGKVKETRRSTAPAGTLKEKKPATPLTEADTDLPKIPKVISDVMNALSALEKVSKDLAEKEMKHTVKDLKAANVDIYRSINDLQVLASAQLLQNRIPKGMLKERRPGRAPPAGMLKEKRTARPAPAPKKDAKKGAKATKGKRKGKHYRKNDRKGKKLKKDANGKKANTDAEKKTGEMGGKGKKTNKGKKKGKTDRKRKSRTKNWKKEKEVKKMMKNLHHTDPRPIHGEGEPHAEARLLLVRTLESVGSAKPVMFLGFIDRGRELVDEAVKHLRAAKMSLELDNEVEMTPEATKGDIEDDAEAKPAANRAAKPTNNDDEAKDEDEEGPTAQAAKPASSQAEAGANEDNAAIPATKSVAESSVDSSEEVDASEHKGPAAAKIKEKTDATNNDDAIPAADAREKGATEDQGMTASKAEKEDATKDEAPRPAAKPADSSTTLSSGEGITG